MNNKEVVDIEIADGIIAPEVTNAFVPIGGGVGNVDLAPYATKADTYTKAEVDDRSTAFMLTYPIITTRAR